MTLRKDLSLDALERNEKEDKTKLDALRAAVLAGEQSGVAEGDVLGEIRSRVRARGAIHDRL